MHFSLFDQWGAKNSLPVWQAFRRGLDRLGLSYSSHDMSADVAVIWSVVWAGKMAANQSVWQAFKKQNRPVLVLEVGSLQRGTTWKLGLNGTGLNSYNFDHLDRARPGKLGLDLMPWRSQGSHVLVACQRDDSQQWYGLPNANEWTMSTIKKLQKYTDRKIIVRPHPRQQINLPLEYKLNHPCKIANTYDDFDLSHALHNAWCVVNYNSGVGVTAVLQGIPAMVGPNSLAAPVGNLDWSMIENPVMPDRESWLIQISHSEWTTDEISTGEPLRRFLKTLESV